MGFDQNSNQPILQPHKRTTKVNIGMVIGILIFFALMAGVTYWYWKHPEKSDPERKSEASTY